MVTDNTELEFSTTEFSCQFQSIPSRIDGNIGRGSVIYPLKCEKGVFIYLYYLRYPKDSRVHAIFSGTSGGAKTKA